MKILSWNVNGVRAVFKKGFADWIQQTQPDILCLQETKAEVHQLPIEINALSAYHHDWVSSKTRKGYSGVGLFSKTAPLHIASGFGIQRFDEEGRVQSADFGDFLLFNVYFPNGKASPERLQYKMDFYHAFLSHLTTLLEKGKRIIVVGDVNTAHTAIDLARPKENEKVSGFLPIEREWIDQLLAQGFVDSFRTLHPEGGHYSWWDLKSGARERNVGWRIDYVFVSENLFGRVKSAFMLPDVMGSDHCPVGVEIG